MGILDTEYNKNNKCVRREGTSNAMKLGNILKEHFAIKNTLAIDQIVSERCVKYHNQSWRLYFTLASSNFEEYYDRIIHTDAALALLRVGISH